jgi:hypothetical protein
VSNLKYVTSQDGIFNVKLGTLLDKDPETGSAVSMNVMADARAGTLKIQAQSAYRDHQEGRGTLTHEQLDRIICFETQVYTDQAWDKQGGDLVAPGGPQALGPATLASSPTHVLNSSRTPVFVFFDSWTRPSLANAKAELRFRRARQRPFPEPPALGPQRDAH